MNVQLIERRFTEEMRAAILEDVTSFVKSRFTLDEYTINKHLIDAFFIQPIYYATLLNYYTMYEQRFTISLPQIYNDDAITETKKEAYFRSLAETIGVNTDNMTMDEIVASVENRITVSDTTMHSDMMNIVNSYQYGFDGATGAFWTMFRNSPKIVEFTTTKFGAAFIYENMSSPVKIMPIETQPITAEDMSELPTINNSGRVTNFIDIYVKPATDIARYSIGSQNDEIDVLRLPPKKWKKITISNYNTGELWCSDFTNGYVGFHEREIEFKYDGTGLVRFECEYYIDDVAAENDIISNHPEYDIMFTGLVPFEATIHLQNKNAVSKVREMLGRSTDGNSWMLKKKELDGILKKSNNHIVDITGKLYVNPLVTKEARIFGENLTISPNSIMSWVDIANTSISAVSIVDMETGDVITV